MALPETETALPEAASPLPQHRASRMAMYSLWAVGILILAAAMYALLRSSSAAADPALTKHHQAGYRLEWSISQYPAVALRDNGFRLQLLDASDQPLSGAKIGIKLEMLDMLCGDYNFELRETSPGVYEGDGVPLMPGLWRATAAVQPEKGDPFKVDRTLKAVY
ncbi:MAG: YtkA-like protein [Paenibacillus sp.]|jgi:hypothetical protein|nr:YtkA-like protein [Paenibacillus sp.]